MKPRIRNPISKRSRVFDEIKAMIRNGLVPTARALSKRTETLSTSTVQYHLDKLEKQGEIKRAGDSHVGIHIPGTVIIFPEELETLSEEVAKEIAKFRIRQT